MFGVATVIGPLLGAYALTTCPGVTPLREPAQCVVVVLMAARTIPSVKTAARVVIDYLGIVFVTIGAGGLGLATSLGGSTYAWRSPQIICMYAVAALALVVFVRVELRATDPMLPMRLFRGRVFSLTNDAGDSGSRSGIAERVPRKDPTRAAVSLPGDVSTGTTMICGRLWWSTRRIASQLATGGGRLSVSEVACTVVCSRLHR